jgi:hypothetical protein
MAQKKPMKTSETLDTFYTASIASTEKPQKNYFLLNVLENVANVVQH